MAMRVKGEDAIRLGFGVAAYSMGQPGHVMIEQTIESITTAIKGSQNAAPLPPAISVQH